MPQPTPALPDDAILLHIGPHKTGTTAIQGILAAAREDLLEHAVTYPGRYGAHHLQARALRRHAAGWVNDTEDLPDEKVWDRFAHSVRSNPGRVVISSEFFAQCNASDRARVVGDLDPGRLHLLIAARNPGSIALSTWQQILRDGKTGHLSDWLEKAFKRSAPIAATKGFWSWADAATLVESWSRVLPIERIRVVVIDEEDRALLPSTFEQLLNLPPGMLATRQPRSSNRGLTAPEAEFLRQVIARNRSRLTWSQFALMIRFGVVAQMIQERRPEPDEPRSALPPWAADQASIEAEFIIDRLRASGVAVTGDLDNLRRLPPVGEQQDFDQIPMSIATHAVGGAITSALKGMDRAEARGRDQAVRQAGRRSRRRSTGQTVDEMSTRELLAVLNTRVKAAAGRRLRPRSVKA